MWNLLKNGGRSVRQTGRNKSLLLNSMHPLSQRRSLNGNGARWLQRKTWRYLLPLREYCNAVTVLCSTVV